jgi:hypothetical protein
MTTIKCDQCGKEITDVLIRLSSTLLPNSNLNPMVYRILPEAKCIRDFIERNWQHGQGKPV